MTSSAAFKEFVTLLIMKPILSSMIFSCDLQAALTWLAYLPVKEDKEEAKVVHALLCSFLER